MPRSRCVSVARQERCLCRIDRLIVGVLPDEVIEPLSVKLSELGQLDHIHPTFAGLDFRDERLRPSNLIGYLDLSQPRFFTRSAEAVQESPVSL